VSSREYWNPLQSVSAAESEPRFAGSEAATTARLPEILREAVLSHLVSDVPVGVFLSGGIDSSALVAVLSQNGVRANTFSLVFQEEEFNEGQYSREVARRFGTEHHEIPVSPQDTLAVLPEAIVRWISPPWTASTSILSRQDSSGGSEGCAHRLGADEMFAGYSNFRRVPKMELFSHRLGRLPKLARWRSPRP